MYDSDDTCGKYTGDYAHTSCQNGYSAGYDNRLQGTVNEIVRDSTAYQQGFDAGARLFLAVATNSIEMNP
ncbi:MAG: hypothetical protein WBZ36_12780 [Candidatus Nitrosopolaris sp.]